ncbi:hypothetical protein HDU86_002243 [Geranomyces michiganensis]|nr:hypothetical protein HDU86_002243 [Geranomyces michiganensis]
MTVGCLRHLLTLLLLQKEWYQHSEVIPSLGGQRAIEKRTRGEKGHPQACLFVASLSSARSDIDLNLAVTLHFQQWGTLLNVKVLKDWMNRPYAFVQFKDTRDARRALFEAHNTILHGRYIRVEQARVNRTLFVAKFTKTIGEMRDPSEIKLHLLRILESYGPIEDLTVLQNYQTGRSKGCGFVKFCYREDAIKAFMGLRTHFKWVAEWAANLDRGNVDVDHTSIFIGQLNPSEITAEMLEERFGQYGQIISLQLVNRYPEGPGTRPAFAFIKYNDEEDAGEAVRNENSKVWLGQAIRVQYRETGDFRMQRPAFGQDLIAGGPGFFPAQRGLQPLPSSILTARGQKMVPYAAGAGHTFPTAKTAPALSFGYRGYRAGYGPESARNGADYQTMPQQHGSNDTVYAQYPVFYNINPYEQPQQPAGSYFDPYSLTQATSGAPYFIPPHQQSQQFVQPGHFSGSARFRPGLRHLQQPIPYPVAGPQHTAYASNTTASQNPPSCAASAPTGYASSQP